MDNQQKQLDPAPQPGELWRTAHGHRVRIRLGRYHDLIETEYVDGKVDGYSGDNFKPTGEAVMGKDRLVERIEG